MSEQDFLISNVFRYGNLHGIGETMHSHHYHDDRFEIYYMVSGKCNYFVNNKCFEVTAGDVVLIPEGVIHRTNYNGEEHTRILIECTSDFVPKDIRIKLSGIGYFYRNTSISHKIYEILKQIEEEYKLSDDYSVEAIRSYVKLLLLLLVRNSNTVGTPEKNVMIESIVSYIKENFHSDITLRAVAKAHFVSPEHLCRSFKRHTGFGFNEFLTLVRLQHAETMLKNREKKSISEIAYSCGFNDSNYFSDKFKKAYGVSPLKYSKDYK